MINELETNLKQALGWHKARVTCFTQIIMGLIAVRSVNLKQLACAFSGEAMLDSNYRRLQRFFAQIRFPKHTVAKFIMGLFFSDEAVVYLSIDRTNWQWGKTPINLLVLSVCYRGVALPLYWTALDKKGNSDTKERITLVTNFIRCFGQHRIGSLLGDREFIGEDWFEYLLQQDIPFDMRVKKTSSPPIAEA